MSTDPSVTGGRAKDPQALAERLGHDFRDTALLRRALTHSSAKTSKKVSRDNERLEFLGDRVLGLCIAELLMEAFPEASEGDLARWLNRLVRRETCAMIADEALDLGAYMIMGRGQTLSDGRRRQTILGNACEAMLGAIFLDGGFDAARGVIRRFWGPYIEERDSVPVDAKTALQEWAQGRGLSVPQYRERARSGPDHAPHFVTTVKVEGCEPARGEGRSKRIAEQDAARALLVREGVWSGPERDG